MLPPISLQVSGASAWLADGGEEGGAGIVYITCMAVLSLSVNYHYLPIYQR